MKEVLIQADQVSKKIGKNASTNQVLKDISLDIYQEDFTIIMGSSGAGKSTLLNVLSGMDSYTNGSIFFLGNELDPKEERQMVKLRSSVFGFVFQNTYLISNLTLLENITVPGYLDHGKSKQEIDQKALSMLEKMNVMKAKDRLPNQVSGGEAQRAAIARAMIHDPQILFADEPTGALNKRNTDEVLDLLTSLNQNGQSILMVTHDVRAAVRGNRIIYLEDGKVIAELKLSAYQSNNTEREEQLTKWLFSLGW